jgi:cytochrome c-type biogenesis protein CcmH/NrfG
MPIGSTISLPSWCFVTLASSLPKGCPCGASCRGCGPTTPGNSRSTLRLAPRRRVSCHSDCHAPRLRSLPRSGSDRTCGLDEDPATAAEAQTAYERALELDPEYVPALINLGNVHYGQGRPDEARACFERAIDRDPANAKARFNLGNVLHDRSEYQAALVLFRDAAALDPDFADAHFNLALTCERLGLAEVARLQWQRYLALEPTGDWAAIAREHLAGSPS